MELRQGYLCCLDHPHRVQIVVACWSEGHWQSLELREDGDTLLAEYSGLRASLVLQRENDCWNYTCEFESPFPTRLLIRLEVPSARNPFHLVPGCIFGDNNMASSLGRAPNLTTAHPDNPSCSPTWELRADRASLPISLLYCDGFLAGISVDPYSQGMPLEADEWEPFVRNGLLAQVAHAGGNDACGITLGYAQNPNFWDGKRLPISQHLCQTAKARGRIYLRPVALRLEIHDVLRYEYSHHRQTPLPPITASEARQSLVDAFLQINWHDETGCNTFGSCPPPMTPFYGGGAIRENFTNMRCIDAAKRELTAWRTLAEIGWSGGSVVADPLLLAGLRQNNPLAVSRASQILDCIAGATNSASGLLWDVVGKHEGTRLNWWWSGYMVEDCHCAYTNGSAAWHLLKAFRDSREYFGNEKDHWLHAACGVLDTIIMLQEPSGNFGYTYAADRRRILDNDGFVGAWFVAALAMAYQLTSRAEYLEAAERGAEYYYSHVAKLVCYGAPMDQHKWPDQEGNLGFMRALPLLHQITGDDKYLAMLTDAAGYEYLWRYGQDTRPQTKPLKDSHWNSCGGNMSGVFSWLHPMGMFVNADLLYLWEQVGDDYHLHRAEDGLNWGINTVSLYPEVMEYGARGVMTECYCQSNPRPGELNADGSPSTIWHSYNGWAAAATLEGLLEAEAFLTN